MKSDLTEIYRQYAIAHLWSDTTSIGEKVHLVPGGAWVEAKLFVPSHHLALGFNFGSREDWEMDAYPEDVEEMRHVPGSLALWDPSSPEVPLLADSYEELIAQLTEQK